MRLLKKLKAEKQKKFLEKLEAQREPLTSKQYKKLMKCDLPPDKSLNEWMLEWGQKGVERQEQQDKLVRDFLQTVLEKLNLENEPSDIRIDPPEPPRKPIKKSAFKWLYTMVACVLCFATMALPFMLDVGGGEKYYTEENVNVIDVPFNDLYQEVAEADNMLIWKEIIEGMGYAKIEVYKDETEELLSYVFSGLAANASEGESLVVFAVDFRIRFVPQYEFDSWDLEYKPLKDSADCLTVGETEVKCLIKETAAYMTFAYGEYDYFLKITTFQLEISAGVFWTVTELNEQNLFLLMKNLLA